MRLDTYLTERKLVESREKAKYLIRKGKVLINDKVIEKPSKDVKIKDNVELKEDFRYVGRGGYKIDYPVKKFDIKFDNKSVLDIGCSTGGFTDYALKNGARKVYAVDIGNTLHERLIRDKKVVYLPNTDARQNLRLDEKIDLCLIDVTFVRLESILDNIRSLLKPSGEVLGLIKPPFQLNEKKRKVRDYEKLKKINWNISDWCEKNGYLVKGIVESQLKGKSAEQDEFFIYLIKK